MKIENCCNPYYQANPIPVPAYSLTYKKEFSNKRKRLWYYEVGLTSAALGYRTVEHDNDTMGIVPWGLFKNTHRGFPSVLFGTGRNIALKNNHEFIVGLEGSLRILHTMGGIISSAFSLEYEDELVTFPLFLRANLGYAVPLKLLGQVPARLQFYTKIAAQNIARGPQYISDPVTGIIRDGEYSLNNSEVGIQFYLDLDKKYYNLMDRPKKERRPRAKRTGKPKMKLSIEHQSFAMRHTKYYMPLVTDSFSLTGGYINATSQIGLKAEFVHFRNPNWSTVVGIGTGRIIQFTQFTATPAFSPNGNAVDAGSGGDIGRYLSQTIGLAYKHGLGKKKLQHTFSLSAAQPIEECASEYSLTIDPGSHEVLVGKFYERYGHNKVLFGLEYSPQLLLHTHKRVYFGLGLVFNYSWGNLANGRATVTNGRTTYYGGMAQRFSKIGITASMGFQGRRGVMDN
ncbi:MAG: hypothetical protein IPN76_23380 [Saprospiraceae bacterium]|nr:hypothetical protein [Saprospiraceae bacterium]